MLLKNILLTIIATTLLVLAYIQYIKPLLIFHSLKDPYISLFVTCNEIKKKQSRLLNPHVPISNEVRIKLNKTFIIENLQCRELLALKAQMLAAEVSTNKISSLELLAEAKM